MHKHFRWIDLQFFAGEGASSGDGGATTAGVGADSAAADAGQVVDTLAAMGVPAAEIRKYRATKGEAKTALPAQQTVTEPTAPTQDAAAAETPRPEQKARKPFAQMLDENPDYKRETESLIQKRLSKVKSENEKLSRIAEMIGKDYGMAAEGSTGIDLDALIEKIETDKKRFEPEAIRRGIDVDTVMRIEKLEDENSRQKKALDEQRRETELRNHYANLQQQAAELRKVFPDFNLDRELENQEFYERTLPGGKDTVESAFYAIHGKEIAMRQAQAAANAAARGASQAMANSIRAGRQMPAENGTVGRAPGNIQTKRYSEMTPSERKAWEREARSGKHFN